MDEMSTISLPILLRVTVMMILCTHLMDGYDFDMVQWFYHDKWIIWDKIEGNFMSLDDTQW